MIKDAKVLGLMAGSMTNAEFEKLISDETNPATPIAVSHNVLVIAQGLVKAIEEVKYQRSEVERLTNLSTLLAKKCDDQAKTIKHLREGM